MSEPVVRVGQVWADNDKRAQPNRRLRVVEMLPNGAVCEVFYEGVPAVDKPRRVAVMLRRFRPNSTGYRLVSE